MTNRDDPAASSDDGVEALVDRACAADSGAWRALVERYATRVFAVAKSRCGSAELAEEITQSVFVTVSTKLTAGQYAEKGRFESWLFRVAMNRIRDEARRAQRQATPTDPEQMRGVAGASAEGLDEGELRRLRSAIAQLNDADREVIHLRHQAGLSFKEIASLLDEPLGTLLARHHRALKKLRSLLQASMAQELS